MHPGAWCAPQRANLLLGACTLHCLQVVEPAQGQVGTAVVLKGERMLGGGTKPSAVSLAGVPVGDVTTFSDTEIKVVAASSAKKTGDIIIVSDSGSVVTLTNGFSYLATAAVSKLVPSAGQRGTKVEIQGVGLL